MAKMMGPRFKQCRRLGLNVCGHPKAMDRAGRGTSRADKKLSPYGLQLLEKQRLRAYYGVLEKQFRNYGLVYQLCGILAIEDTKEKGA